jgi:hypothetical protein
MRASGSRRMMGGYLNGNAAKLPGWLTATLMAAAAIVLFAAAASDLPSVRAESRTEAQRALMVKNAAPVNGRNRGVA